MKTFWQNSDNCIQCVQKNIFTNDNFFEKQIIWYFFSDFELNVLAFCRKTVGEVVKTAFFVPIKTVQVVFSEKHYSFWSFLYIEWFFWTLCWKFSDEVVKTASYLFIGSFWWEKFFDEETLMFFIQFETFSEKVLAVCREFL